MKLPQPKRCKHCGQPITEYALGVDLAARLLLREAGIEEKNG